MGVALSASELPPPPTPPHKGEGSAPAQVDVLIAGGGLPGLALAIALKQGLGETFKVAVADPAFSREPANDPRASAIAAAARHLLQTIGVWDALAADAQPILDMTVTDSRLTDVVRPVYLSFAGEIAPGEPFAHMVENRHLMAALNAKARESGVELLPQGVSDFVFDTHPDPPPFWGRETLPHGHPPPERGRNEEGVISHRIHAQLADDTCYSARLLVAADGARSKIRERAGIQTFGWDYPQSAIATTVAHERDHNGRAQEHFLPAGPFAILPLKDRRASIVWTETTEEAARVVALPDGEFLAELERRFGLELGDLTLTGPRRAYPLGFSVARSFIAERLALVGDAAHVIHPIAGQGLNIGLRDVAALAEAIADAARLGLDVGGAEVLDRYQRWRRFDTMGMGIATDGLNRLFSNQSDILKVMRDLGIGVVDRLPALKELFIREAAGLTGQVPKLMRGEAL